MVNANAVRILFQRDGFEVLVADDGLAARDLIAREYVDVVLTDIRMPRLDGIGLLKAARELAPDAIICMMTAHFTRDSDEWRRAREQWAATLFEKVECVTVTSAPEKPSTAPPATKPIDSLSRTTTRERLRRLAATKIALPPVTGRPMGVTRSI